MVLQCLRFVLMSFWRSEAKAELRKASQRWSHQGPFTRNVTSILDKWSHLSCTLLRRPALPRFYWKKSLRGEFGPLFILFTRSLRTTRSDIRGFETSSAIPSRWAWSSSHYSISCIGDSWFPVSLSPNPQASSNYAAKLPRGPPAMCGHVATLTWAHVARVPAAVNSLLLRVSMNYDVCFCTVHVFVFFNSKPCVCANVNILHVYV